MLLIRTLSVGPCSTSWAFLPIGDVDAAIRRWQVPDAGGAATAPTLTQLGQAGIFARTCRVVCGVSATATPPAGVMPAAPTATTSNARKVKMSHVINQADEEEVDILDQAAINAAYQKYVDKTGGYPPEDEELSAEQLTTLHSLFKSNRVPYTDMAVWGPFQHRIQKKIKLKGVRFSSTGELQPIEMYGPPDFDAWRECYMVFRTGAIMFEQITPAKLDRYEKLIRGYSDRYGRECWPIIYQADVRARLEHAERVRRQGHDAYETAQRAGLTHPYDPAKPWDWVWQQMSMEILGFWQKEVVEPCMLYLSKASTLRTLVDDDAPVHGTSADSSGSAARPAKRARGPDIREHMIGDDGNYSHNRRGVELCRLFQSGECLEKDSRGNCARNSSRRHQCAKCLSEGHGANKCSADGPKPPRANHGRGKGKGRGRK